MSDATVSPVAGSGSGSSSTASQTPASRSAGSDSTASSQVTSTSNSGDSIKNLLMGFLSNFTSMFSSLSSADPNLTSITLTPDKSGGGVTASLQDGANAGASVDLAPSSSGSASGSSGSNGAAGSLSADDILKFGAFDSKGNLTLPSTSQMNLENVESADIANKVSDDQLLADLQKADSTITGMDRVMNADGSQSLKLTRKDDTKAADSQSGGSSSSTDSSKKADSQKASADTKSSDSKGADTKKQADSQDSGSASNFMSQISVTPDGNVKFTPMTPKEKNEAGAIEKFMQDGKVEDLEAVAKEEGTGVAVKIDKDGNISSVEFGDQENSSASASTASGSASKSSASAQNTQASNDKSAQSSSNSQAAPTAPDLSNLAVPTDAASEQAFLTAMYQRDAVSGNGGGLNRTAGPGDVAAYPDLWKQVAQWKKDGMSDADIKSKAQAAVQASIDQSPEHANDAKALGNQAVQDQIVTMYSSLLNRKPDQQAKTIWGATIQAILDKGGSMSDAVAFVTKQIQGSTEFKNLQSSSGSDSQTQPKSQG